MGSPADSHLRGEGNAGMGKFIEHVLIPDHILYPRLYLQYKARAVPKICKTMKRSLSLDNSHL